LGAWARFSNAELGRIAQIVEAEALAAERSKARGRGKAAEPLIPLRAAVMLQLDLDEAQRPPAGGTEQPRRCPGKQAEIAARYASVLAWNEETRSFARRFFLALANNCQWDACFLEAQRWAREGPQALSARRGAVALGRERARGIRDDLGRRLRRPEPRPRSPLPRGGTCCGARQAQYRFEEALASDDGLTLARVRRGRVLWRLGEREAAQGALEEAVERSADPQLLFLALLGRAAAVMP
jgi:tetratricopeptide (TPR) repeat protein